MERARFVFPVFSRWGRCLLKPAFHSPRRRLSEPEAETPYSLVGQALSPSCIALRAGSPIAGTLTAGRSAHRTDSSIGENACPTICRLRTKLSALTRHVHQTDRLD